MRVGTIPEDEQSEPPVELTFYPDGCTKFARPDTDIEEIVQHETLKQLARSDHLSLRIGSAIVSNDELKRAYQASDEAYTAIPVHGDR